MDQMFWVWMGFAVFLGILLGYAIKALFEENREKFLRRMIYEHTNSLSVHMNNTCERFFKEWKNLDDLNRTEGRKFSDYVHEQRLAESRQFDEKQYQARMAAARSLREQLEKAHEELYVLPMPPEQLAGDFCPENWLHAIKQISAGRNISVTSLLPWFREAMMAGYSSGKKIGEVALQQKGKRK